MIIIGYITYYNPACIKFSSLNYFSRGYENEHRPLQPVLHTHY